MSEEQEIVDIFAEDDELYNKVITDGLKVPSISINLEDIQ